MNAKETKKRKALFIKGFEKTGVIGTGCRKANISRNTHRAWAEKDPEFLAACQDAYQTSIDLAEEELRARSVEGVDEVVLYKGEPIWKRDPETGKVLLDDDFNPVPFTVKKTSDRLLEVYIKAHKPGYREPKGGVVVHIDPVPKAISDFKEGGEEGDGIQITYILPDGKEVTDYEDGAQKKLIQNEPEISDEEWDEFLK